MAPETDNPAAPKPPRLVWLALNASHSHASLALPRLHAACARAGVAAEWLPIEATLAEAPGELAARLAALEPDVLAATAWLFNLELLLKIVRRVKALRPATVIILGGPEFLGDNGEFLQREPAVNAVFRGEGEAGFPVWLARWNRPEEWHGIPGLCFPPPMQSIEQKTLRHKEKDLLCASAPSVKSCSDNGLARLDAAALAAQPPVEDDPFFAWDKPFVPLETARGCVNRCAFCTSAGDAPVRALAADAVGAALARFREHGVREVRVLDRTFNADPGRALELLHQFRTEAPQIRFHLEIHPAFLTAALRTELASWPPDRLHLEAGVQATDGNVLAASGRRGGADAAWDGLLFLCGLTNLEVHADLLAGLPGLTLPMLLDDLRRITLAGPAEIQLEILKLLPGTIMRGQAAELGLIFAPDPPYEVLRTPRMSPEDLQTARRLSRVIDGWHNAAAWRGVVRAAASEHPDFLPEFTGHLAARHVLGMPLGLERRGELLWEFARSRDWDEVADDVATAWMTVGLPPGRCPSGSARPWKDPAPENRRRTATVWRLDTRRDGPWFFAYDRGVAASRPIRIWREEPDGAGNHPGTE